MPPMGNKNFKTTAKPKHFKQTATRMLKDFKSDRKTIIVIILFSILSAVVSILSPIFLKEILGKATPTIDPDTQRLVSNEMFTFEYSNGDIILNWSYFFTAFGILIGIYVLSALFSWMSEWFSIKVSSKYAYNMRSRIQNKLENLPLSYFDKVPYGNTLSTGTNDVDNISRNLQTIISQIFNGVTLFIGTVVAMFIVEYRLAFVAIGILPLVLAVVLLIAKFSQKQFKSYRKELAILNGKVEEDYAGYKIIKLFNKEQDVINSFEETNVKLAKADGISQFLSGLIFPATHFINNLGFVGIAVIGGVINQPATMISFFLLINLFTRPFQSIGQISNVIQSVVASAERIYTLLDEQEQSPDSTEPLTEDNIKGEYSFENVDFAYSADKPLIQNMNLKVNPGDKVAIVGPTGAGKTTIVNLLMRFYDINSGEIKLDGRNIEDYPREVSRGAVGMVLQDTWLFRGTIRDNIKYGAPESTEEEMITACKEAHIYHFIQTLPGKFDFMLNEDGNNISQGQKQLITIARAILSKPKIMILDEATSSVDTRTEQQIQDAMNRIMEGRTSFIIAHRLSTIKNAKTIIVMKKGNIIETGNHKELLALNGFYADLYNSQFLGNTTDTSVQES